MDDDVEIECAATRTGIVQCLRMLAEEAAVLNLSRTLLAIHEALETCEREGSEASGQLPSGVTLH